MEKLIVEENGFIEEEIYQKIKKETNKKSDFLDEHEFSDFNATAQINLNKCKQRKLKLF